MSGFYNLVNGYNPACIYILPLTGFNENTVPRFRDCWVEENPTKNPKHIIAIHTRVGGGNRNCGFGEEILQNDPNFIYDEDDDFDNTYATYYFKCPQKWQKDFELIMENKVSETSKEYQNLILKTYPQLKEQLQTIFKNESK